MERLDQLEHRIDDAIAHYETHKAAFETLSQKLASYNGIRAEVLEEVKGWIAELRESEKTDTSAPIEAQVDATEDVSIEGSEEGETASEIQKESELETERAHE